MLTPSIVRSKDLSRIVVLLSHTRPSRLYNCLPRSPLYKLYAFTLCHSTKLTAKEQSRWNISGETEVVVCSDMAVLILIRKRFTGKLIISFFFTDCVGYVKYGRKNAESVGSCSKPESIK